MNALAKTNPLVGEGEDIMQVEDVTGVIGKFEINKVQKSKSFQHSYADPRPSSSMASLFPLMAVTIVCNK